MQNDARILVQINHRDPLLAMGIEALLGRHPDLMLRAPDSGATPEVQICDFKTGLALARDLRRAEAAPSGRVLIVAGEAKEWDVREAIESGVGGYIVNGGPIEELIDAVRAVGSGLRYMGPEATNVLADSLFNSTLTFREREVLCLLAAGCCNKEISNELDVALATVKTHLRALFSKLGVNKRTQAIVVATERGIVNPLQRQPQRHVTRGMPQFHRPIPAAFAHMAAFAGSAQLGERR